jgi:hypothetical protein
VRRFEKIPTVTRDLLQRQKAEHDERGGRSKRDERRRNEIDTDEELVSPDDTFPTRRKNRVIRGCHDETRRGHPPNPKKAARHASFRTT